MYVGGDSEDLIIFRWDKDHQCSTKLEGCEGKLEIKEGSAIVPTGELTVNRLIHIVETINAPGGAEPAPAELLAMGYGMPSKLDGTPLLYAQPFLGGFFTGYWFVTGKELKAEQINVIGGLYTNTPHFEVKESGGMTIEPLPNIVELVDEKCWRSVGVAADATLTLDMEARLAEEFGTQLEGVKLAIQERVKCEDHR
eukprot:scaffold2376_cov188-Amphora_coffeaeformis.AAC.9